MTDFSTQLSGASAKSTATDRGGKSDTSLLARDVPGHDVSPFARELSRANERHRSSTERDNKPEKTDLKPDLKPDSKPDSKAGNLNTVETPDTRNKAAHGPAGKKTTGTEQPSADELSVKTTPIQVQPGIPEDVAGDIPVKVPGKPIEPSQVPGVVTHSPTPSHLTSGKSNNRLNVVPNTVATDVQRNALATDVEATKNVTSSGRRVPADAAMADTNAATKSDNNALITAASRRTAVSTPAPDERTSARAETVPQLNAKPSGTPADPVGIQSVNGRAVLNSAVNPLTRPSTSGSTGVMQGTADPTDKTLELTTAGSGKEVLTARVVDGTELPAKPTGKSVVPGATLKSVATNSVIQPATRSDEDLLATAANSVVQGQRISSSVLRVGDTVSTSAIANHFKQLSVNDNSKTAIAAINTSGSDESAGPAGIPIGRPVTTLTGIDAKNKVMPENTITRSMNLVASYKGSSSGSGEISASKLKTDQLTAMASRAASHTSSASSAPALPVEVNAGMNFQELTSAAADTLKKKVEAGKGIALPGLTAPAALASLTDNMLPDSSGGIVTAPVLTRTDSVTTQMVSTPLSVPLMLPAASDAMASNVSWMVKEGVQNASVNVMPAGMGPISVNIGIENEQMNVSIVATQGTTREALEALLPRLREQLLTQGVDSVKVEISDGKSDQNRGSNTQNPTQAFERQSFANEQGAGRDANQAGNRNTEDSDTRNDRVNTESGERELTDAEKARVASLQGVLPQTMPRPGEVMHGYDLYV